MLIGINETSSWISNIPADEIYRVAPRPFVIFEERIAVPHAEFKVSRVAS